MPTYDFQCNACGAFEEQFLRISELDSARCPSCGSSEIEQVVSSRRSLIFFRGGWYEHITDRPLYIRSMKELKQACEDHDSISQYAEDSLVLR